MNIDKTFCEYYKECHYGYCCHRALTKSIKKKIGEIPISVFTEKPKCFEEKVDG